MYRKPILWTLYNALDFLKVLKCIYYVPVDDGWDQVLGRNVYIMSQLMMAGIKYWDVMYTLRPSTVLGHNVYITSQYFSPNAKD